MLVSSEWLAEHLGEPGLAVVDLRWREDGSGPTRFELGHIPGAVFCDWATDLVDPNHRFAFMLAPPAPFAAAMERFGIGDDTEVVAYADDLGSGPFRLWWAFGIYGHPAQVRILDGGFERWIADGNGTERGKWSPRPGPEVRWAPRPTGAPIATARDVAAAEHDPGMVVLDSRPASQFRGEEVWFETGSVPADADGIARTRRGELRAGRVPWARNVPAAALYGADRRLKDPAELRALFAEVGIRAEDAPLVIAYCGVGISASAVLYALQRAGVEDVRLYDASWDEWGRDPRRAVARTPTKSTFRRPGVGC
jgi:thiosulfate/3-mercaptopyruvate sulfurtransferase